MHPPGPVRWTQGMFLLPQHFQQTDLHNAAERGYTANVLIPFAWGLRKLEVAEEDLKQEVFRVRHCEALFPDGLLCRYPIAASLEPASFKDFLKPTMEKIGAYLCVANIDPRKGASDRYASQSASLRDLYPAQANGSSRGSDAAESGEEERPVEYAIPRARILFTNDPTDGILTGSQHIKLAEIRRTGIEDRPYELSRNYVPPVVRCEASAALMREIERILQNLVALTNQLSGYRRGDEGTYTPADLLQLMKLQTVNHLVPALQHAWTNGGGHPFPLYGLLLQGRGALTTYCPRLSPEPHDGVVPYDHLDLARCFRWVTDSIQAHIDELYPTQREEIELLHNEEFFIGVIKDELLKEASEFVLIVKGGANTDSEQLRRRVDKTAKIASSRKIQDLIDAGISGVPFAHQEAYSPHLPRLRDACYFGINTKHERWKWLKDDSTFTFYLPDAEADVEVRLFAVLPRGSNP